ncbi:hypothetical protein [Acinetobacter sp. YH12123]|uniref:hypothetical protein n=1 Tax=Acinetobacter sp. YH12123 TaxID=2601108 RepID=UPI0015D3D320|nr:hypothetical protein [Acinetobacter sp. YH12123]
MKANEFVKKFGWEEAKEIVDNLPEKFKFKPLGSVCWDNNTYKYSDRFKPRSSLVNMADLKRLVESWELVESYGGIQKIREDTVDLEEWEENSELWKMVKQAIQDVESCQ